LQIDTVTSALPAGAATEATLATLGTEATLAAFAAAAATAANQATMITALQLIDDLRNALDSVGTDELDVNVEASVLPTGAATAANQVIINTTVGLVALIRNALQTVDTDRLIVRGEDQLFSLHGVLALQRGVVISGADGYGDSLPVPAGEYWVVTTIAAFDNDSPCTEMIFYNRHDGINVGLHDEIRAFAITDRSTWSGMTVLDVDDVIRVDFPGALAGDDVYVEITGYRMTPEV